MAAFIARYIRPHQEMGVGKSTVVFMILVEVPFDALAKSIHNKVCKMRFFGMLRLFALCRIRPCFPSPLAGCHLFSL